MNTSINLTLCTARMEGTGDFLSDNGQLIIKEGANYLCAWMDDEQFMIYHEGMFYSVNSINFDF